MILSIFIIIWGAFLLCAFIYTFYVLAQSIYVYMKYKDRFMPGLIITNALSFIIVVLCCIHWTVFCI